MNSHKPSVNFLAATFFTLYVCVSANPTCVAQDGKPVESNGIPSSQVNPFTSTFRVLNSKGEPAVGARFFQSDDRLLLNNLGSADRYPSPSILDNQSKLFLDGQTDEKGECRLQRNMATIIVSKSENEFSFVSPNSLGREIRMLPCGKLSIDTSSFENSSSEFYFFVIWKNCLAGSVLDIPTKSSNWKLFPYFTICSQIVSGPSAEPIEIMLPPGEVSICVMTKQQSDDLQDKLSDAKTENELLLNLPSTMGIHMIRPGETTKSQIKLGRCLIGKINLEESRLPDWSGTDSKHGPLKLFASISPESVNDDFAQVENRIKSIDGNKGFDEKLVVDSYIEMLESNEGREYRGTRFKNIPVLLDRSGQFSTLPLPAGKVTFVARRQTKTLSQNSHDGNLIHYVWISEYDLDAGAVGYSLGISQVTENELINGEISGWDLGTVFIDSKPSSSIRIPASSQFNGSLPAEYRDRRIVQEDAAVKEAAPTVTLSDELPSDGESITPVSPNSFRNLDELKQRVSKEFDLRHFAREKELKELESKLYEAKQRLARRRENRDKIIQKRVDEILRLTKPEDPIRRSTDTETTELALPDDGSMPPPVQRDN